MSNIIKSKVEEVTVFFRGAELIHTAEAMLTKGNNEILITGFSPNVDRSSIKVKTTGGAVISSFEFSTDYLHEEKPSEKAQNLLDTIKEQQKLSEQISTEIKINTDLLDILQKSIHRKASKAKTGLSIDELMKTMDYYKSKAGELEKTIAGDREKEEKITEYIQDLSAQFEQESLKNNKTSGILKLSLSSPIDGTCRFTVSYYTASASWTPYHDINVASTDGPIKITSKAKVRQVTGIDWNAVKLTLSTAVPSSGKSAPLFHAWFLQYIHDEKMPLRKMAVSREIMQNSYSYEEMKSEIAESDALPAPDQGTPLYVVDGMPVDIAYFGSIDQSMIKSVNYLSGSEATAIYGPAAAGGAVEVTLKNGMDDYVTFSENQLNVSFRIDLPYSIPGNGKEQGIELKNADVAATFMYYCAPKLDSETYLLAEIADPEKLNLLSGNANITYDGTYVGETYIDAATTQQKLSLTLGIDRRVAVKREKINEYTGAGFFGNEINRKSAYRMTVRNNRNETVRMVLKDQYPISTIKEVTVELSKDTTPPSFDKKETGVVTWEYDMQPGELRTFDMVYVVKYPKGKTLNL